MHMCKRVGRIRALFPALFFEIPCLNSCKTPKREHLLGRSEHLLFILPWVEVETICVIRWGQQVFLFHSSDVYWFNNSLYSSVVIKLTMNCNQSSLRFKHYFFLNEGLETIFADWRHQKIFQLNEKIQMTA